MDLRSEFAKRRYLDTITHILVGIIIWYVLCHFLSSISKKLIFISVFSGTFFPDIDHLLIYKKAKFKSFKNFLKWSVKSNRYRIEFELFHNFPSVIFIGISLPFLYMKSYLVFSFFLAFLFHLLVDICIDRMVLKTLRQWRFTSKI